MTAPKTRRLAIAALVTTNLIWALAIPLAKKAFDEGLTPMLFLQTRFIIAALATLPFSVYSHLHQKKSRRLHSGILPQIILLEVLGITLTLGLLYAGLSRSSAIDATLITTALPLFITVGGILFLKERETRFEIIGLLLSFMGSLLLVLNGSIISLNPKNPGNLLILLHNLANAGYFLLAKKLYKPYSKLIIAQIGAIVGAVSFTIVTRIDPLTAFGTLIALGPWSILAVLYMGFLGSVIAFSLYLYGQDKIEASEASLFGYLNPVFAIPASILLLQEAVGVRELVASAFILAGVFIAQRRKK